MATENPTWGYTRIQGALKNVGHCVDWPLVCRSLTDGDHTGRHARRLKFPTSWRYHSKYPSVPSNDSTEWTGFLRQQARVDGGLSPLSHQ